MQQSANESFDLSDYVFIQYLRFRVANSVEKSYCGKLIVHVSRSYTKFSYNAFS